MNNIKVPQRRIRLTEIGSIVICLLFIASFANRYLVEPILYDEVRIAKDNLLYSSISTYADEGSFYDRNGTIISDSGIMNNPDNYSYAWLLGYYTVSQENENIFGLRGNLKDYIYFLLDKDNKGATVNLTTDSRIQNFAYTNILNGQEGSVIVLDNKTGKILTLASNSTVSYDGNDPISILSSDIPDSQFRRGTFEKDPPGSTFKVITSIAALEKAKEEQLNDTFFDYFDDGTYQPEGDKFIITNYNHYSYGAISLNEAMESSVNCYFADLGVRVGKDRILDVASRFMLGKDIEIPFLDTISSSMDMDDATIADVAQLSFGQGKTEVTPMNLALIAEAIGNNGVMKQPHIVDSITHRSFNIYKAKNEDLNKCAEEDVIIRLKEAMHKAALAYGLNENFGEVYAKTGTAECANDRLHTYIMVCTDDVSFVISMNNGDISNSLYGYAQSLLGYIQSLQ